MDNLPIWLLLLLTTSLILIAIEFGFRIGFSAHRRSEEEKEAPVSAISAAILGLLAFILAFTFDIVSERYDHRKELVRDEANAIRTSWMRSDFLPDNDIQKAKELLKKYVENRLIIVDKVSINLMSDKLKESERIQNQLWDMAVNNAKKDMNSDVAALYIESLNEIVEIHRLRIAVGLQMRIPFGIWVVLYALIISGMFSIGYQTAISGSRRSWVKPILAVSFSLVITLIAALDNPSSGYLPVSQQPLIELFQTMNEASVIK
jgi:hypothetical protein